MKEHLKNGGLASAPELLGYYQHATIHGDRIVFVCEGDLWTVSTRGGMAIRLTTTAAGCAYPRVSPDGKQIAFVGKEDGPAEVYVMPLSGGAPQRVTHFGGYRVKVNGWTARGKILAIAAVHSPLSALMQAYKVNPRNGEAEALKLGWMESIAIGRRNATVIGTNLDDGAHWKRYRGGMAGEVWVDHYGEGQFTQILKDLGGNIVSPFWLGERVYFVSDHEGIGNLYSCRANGSDVRQHTKHTDFYVRHPSTDGTRIVYTAGADIWLYDPVKDSSTKVNVAVRQMTKQRERRFVNSSEWFEHYSPHPDGDSLGIIARGQPLTKPNWDGHATQHGVGNRVRYRLLEWLRDGNRFVVVSDAPGFERLELHYADQSKQPIHLTTQELGRFTEMACDEHGHSDDLPKMSMVAAANHRNELILVDLESRRVQVIDKCPHGQIRDLCWSPDGQWIAYTYPTSNMTPGTSRIRVYNVRNGVSRDLTKEVLRDRLPVWDATGDYLFFASARTFKPVRDTVKNDCGFVYAERLYALPLRANVGSPFIQKAQPLVTMGRGERADESAELTPKVDIEFEGIQDRLIPFPESAVPMSDFVSLAAVYGRLFFMYQDRLSAAFNPPDHPLNVEDHSPRDALLFFYDFEQQRSVFVDTHASRLRASLGGEFIFYVRGEDYSTVRVLDAMDEVRHDTEEMDEPIDEYSRRSGLINIGDISVSVNPPEEWAQMFHETWRMQQHQFWDHNLNGIDWTLIRDRYAALLPRVRTRAELSDVIREMIGELGTSHTYEWFGEYPESPSYHQAYLGAKFSWDDKRKGYRIDEIVRGSPGEPEADSPLAEPGLNIVRGELIVAVDGTPVSESDSVEKLLVNKSDKRVGLSIKDAAGHTRQVTVSTLEDETPLYYRAWVNENRDYVHKHSNGKVGYVHIPDMMEEGFGEFYRSYMLEHLKEGLIVDFRSNGGGNVSPLILQVLSRKVIGFGVSRHNGVDPYPYEAMSGPKVGITDQFAGSDGDMIGHAFKLNGIGPLVGKRSWGGVIGINPEHMLVDGTMICVPEFASWFHDVKWDLENRGVVPDVEVDIAPQDYKANSDPQLDKAIDLVMESLAKNPVVLPDFSEKPHRPLPTTDNTANGAPARKGKAT